MQYGTTEQTFRTLVMLSTHRQRHPWNTGELSIFGGHSFSFTPWHRDMETFPTLLWGESIDHRWLPRGFPSQRPTMKSFDVSLLLVWTSVEGTVELQTISAAMTLMWHYCEWFWFANARVEIWDVFRASEHWVNVLYWPHWHWDRNIPGKIAPQLQVSPDHFDFFFSATWIAAPISQMWLKTSVICMIWKIL